jgi:hypothetical protein
VQFSDEHQAGGDRQYSYDVKGGSGWRARYVKEVGAEELTVRVYQEICGGCRKAA